MPLNTKIEWTDHSWSPWRGCTKVSPGCANCYADGLAKRFGDQWGGWGNGKSRVLAKNWGDPRKWDRESLAAWDAERGKGLPMSHPPRPTVFPSLCDWLDEEVPIEWLARFLALIHDTPNLTWLLLTKRPHLWIKRLAQVLQLLGEDGYEGNRTGHFMIRHWLRGAPPMNVWVGTSVEDQPRADERVPALLKIPAVGRFISAEPLIGPVTFHQLAFLNGCYHWMPSGPVVPSIPDGIKWVIVGGESGPASRPCNIDWVRSLVRQCSSELVPCFVKQLGANACFDSGEGYLKAHPIIHPKGGDPAEWPDDLRVRQFPKGIK